MSANHFESSVSEFVCPTCGAKKGKKISDDLYLCPYCGTKFVFPKVDKLSSELAIKRLQSEIEELNVKKASHLSEWNTLSTIHNKTPGYRRKINEKRYYKLAEIMIPLNKQIEEKQQKLNSYRQISEMTNFNDFIGQKRIKELLIDQMNKFLEKGISFPPIIFCGENGIGKKTLVKAIGEELKVNLYEVAISSDIKPGDLLAKVSNMNTGDIIYLENIQNLRSPALEVVLSVIDKNSIEIIIGKGPAARAVSLKLPSLSIFGSSENRFSIQANLASYFSVFEFDAYTINELESIIRNFSDVDIDEKGLAHLIRLSEGNPGKAERTIKWILKHTNAANTGKITQEEIKTASNFLGISSTTLSDGSLNIDKMNGYEFEQFIASIYRKKGYLVNITQHSGDHGIDLILRKEEESIAVQCKRWNTPVGESIVRDFFGSMANGNFQKGIIITSDTYTQQAVLFCKNKTIKLIDRQQLEKMISEIQ